MLVDTVSTMYAGAVNFFLISFAVASGLRGAAAGIERFELTFEQSDITAALERDVGTAAAGRAGEDHHLAATGFNLVSALWTSSKANR